jgi:hypothetical protein
MGQLLFRRRLGLVLADPGDGRLLAADPGLGSDAGHDCGVISYVVEQALAFTGMFSGQST